MPTKTNMDDARVNVTDRVRMSISSAANPRKRKVSEPPNAYLARIGTVLITCSCHPFRATMSRRFSSTLSIHGRLGVGLGTLGVGLGALPGAYGAPGCGAGPVGDGHGVGDGTGEGTTRDGGDTGGTSMPGRLPLPLPGSSVSLRTMAMMMTMTIITTIATGIAKCPVGSAKLTGESAAYV
jgi:hypothetical protein